MERGRENSGIPLILISGEGRENSCIPFGRKKTDILLILERGENSDVPLVLVSKGEEENGIPLILVSVCLWKVSKTMIFR